jgi:hypothetical protein
MKNLIRVLVLPVLFLVSSHACHAQMFLGDYPNNLRYYSAEIQIRYNNPGLVLPRSEFFSHKLDKGVSFLEDTLPKLVPGDYKYARVFDSVFTFDSSGLMKERKRFAQMANLPDGSVVQYGDVIRYIYVVPFSDEDFNFFFIIRYYNGRLNSVTVIDQHKKRDGMSTLWNGKEDVVLVGKNNSINPEDYPLQCLEYLLDYRRKEYQRLYKEPALAVAPPVQTGDTAKIATSGPGGAMWKQGKVIRFDTSGMKKDTVQRLTYFGLKLLNVSIPVSKKVEPVKYAFNLPKVKLEDDDILVPVDSQLLADVDAQIAENAKFLKEMKEESFANHRRRKEDRLISSISLASPATLSVVKPVMTNAKPISFNFKLPEIKIEEVLDTPSVIYIVQ